MASPTVADLFSRLNVDEWRTANDFKPDLSECHRRIIGANSPDLIRSALLGWLGINQPCLFGRVAARAEAISTCIITEADLQRQSDEWICNHIQSARTEWTRAGFAGRSSGFIILVVSDKVARATPDDAMCSFAKRLLSLYLLRDDVRQDAVYHDEVFLEVPTDPRASWKWLAGINYFSAAADGRWWHDHRIPGGMAFSVNSVGHLVKSGILVRHQAQLAADLGLESEERLKTIDSLPKALEWAMRTINMASDSISGQATCLLDRTAETTEPPCPLPRILAGKEHRFYQGYYHTDFTLPAEYFIDNVTRPHVVPFDLDLTYLFDPAITNPDHILMGKGRRIRGAEVDVSWRQKVEKATPQEIEIASSVRLLDALGELN